jgi:hypothetical protein
MRQHARCATALVAMILVAATAAGQSRKSRVRVIAGEQVVLLKPTGALPLVEARDLKFYTCKLKRTGKLGTVVSGNIISRLPHQNYVITIEIDMYESVSGHSGPGGRGAMKAEIDRPKPNTPVRFTARGPEWQWDSINRPAVPTYHLRVSFRTWKPLKPD